MIDRIFQAEDIDAGKYKEEGRKVKNMKLLVEEKDVDKHGPENGGPVGDVEEGSP